MIISPDRFRGHHYSFASGQDKLGWDIRLEGGQAQDPAAAGLNQQNLERIHQDPGRDLVEGVCYYTLVVLSHAILKNPVVVNIFGKASAEYKPT